MIQHFMYIRPGNLHKDFLVEKKKESTNSIGRPITEYVTTDKVIHGILSEASGTEKMRFEQLQHPVTHTIVQTGYPNAKPGDKLVRGDRVFLIKQVENPSELSVCTIYYAEERADVR